MAEPEHGGALGRRTVLRSGAAASAGLLLPAAGRGTPALALAGRPEARWGVRTGDVGADSGLVWVRADRPARMMVETSATESFRTRAAGSGPLLGPGHRLHRARPRCAGCRPASRSTTGCMLGRPGRPAPHRRAGHRHVPHRARAARATACASSGRATWPGRAGASTPTAAATAIFEEMRPRWTPTSSSAAATTSTRTARSRRPRDPARRPDLAERHHRGEVEGRRDPRGVPRQLPLQPAGRQPAALRRPGALDHPVGRPRGAQQLVPGPRSSTTTGTPEKDVDVLAARSLRAFSEYLPISTLRPGPATAGSTGCVRHGPLLDVFVLDMRTLPRRQLARPPGATTPRASSARQQLDWLKRELSRSRAVWKVIASDMPLGLVVPRRRRRTSRRWRRATRARRSAASCRSPSCCGTSSTTGSPAPCGSRRTCTTPRAQHYEPSRAAFKDFEPFWEFVSGPLNAGGFPAGALDGTFGPEQVFVKAPTAANVSPAEGRSTSARSTSTARAGELTVRLREEGGAVLFTQGAAAGPGRPVGARPGTGARRRTSAACRRSRCVTSRSRETGIHRPAVP